MNQSSFYQWLNGFLEGNEKVEEEPKLQHQKVPEKMRKTIRICKG